MEAGPILLTERRPSSFLKLRRRSSSAGVFNVFDTTRGEHLSDAQLREFCGTHGLTPVPLAFSGDAFDESLESPLQKAEGLYAGTENQREASCFSR